MIEQTVIFEGFPEQVITFLIQLRANNNREWFNENKLDFKEYVEKPAKIFGEELSLTLTAITRLPMTFKLFRIYRDVRFSKDKTPFNTHIHISFSSSNTDKNCSDKPSFFFGLETDRIITGCGYFVFSPEMLIDYRQTVGYGSEGKVLHKLLEKLLSSEGCNLHEPELKRIPSGFEKNHPQGELLRRKGLVIWHEEELSNKIYHADFIPHIMNRFTSMQPVYNWLNKLSLKDAI